METEIQEQKKHIHRICRIRHEATKYDEYAIFYRAAFPELRTKLNRLCAKVLLDKIGLEEFFTKVEELESAVNLNKRQNRKRFIKKEIIRIQKTWAVTISTTKAKTIAERNLAEIMKIYNNQRERNKLI